MPTDPPRCETCDDDLVVVEDVVVGCERCRTEVKRERTYDDEPDDPKDAMYGDK